ncbi:MAG: cytidine/deoxycytidylate deaminase family protein [Candidatus Altiarchaeota archaeon]
MTDKRPSWDEYFMKIVYTVAERATCDRGKNGCVIAKEKRILSTGYVGAPAGLAHCDEAGHQMKTVVHEDGSKSRHCVRTCHAEENAIVHAAKVGVSVDGATIYTKMTPCYNCAKMIINAGISRVVADKDYHSSAESKKLFDEAGVSLKIVNGEVEKYEDQ